MLKPGGECHRCCAAGRSGCDAGGEAPLFSGSFPVPDRAVLPALPLPPEPGGRGVVLVPGPEGGTLVLDASRRSPLTAAAECGALVLACYAPGVRNLAGCFETVPVCLDGTPWEGDDPLYCAAGCAVRYWALRRAGLDEARAATEAVLGDGGCSPGVDAQRSEAGS